MRKKIVLDDITAQCYISGDGAHPLLLLHGNGGSHRSFDGVKQNFAAENFIVAPDARAQGRTPRGDKPLTYKQLADDALALVDNMGLDHPDIVGYSDGGIVALIMASRSKNVGRVITLGANFSEDGTTPDFESYCTRYLEKSKKWIKMRRVKRKRELIRLMIDPNSYDDFTVLKNIQTPVLLMVGDRDVVPFAHTQKLCDAIDGARIVVLDNCGHRILRERPAEFLKIAHEFLDR